MSDQRLESGARDTGGISALCQRFERTIRQGNLYYAQGQFDLAEEQYRLALRTEPDNETAKFNLANALQKQKKYDDAVKLLEELAGRSKNNSIKSSSYYNEGVAYSKQKDLENSIEAYKKSLRINPADQDARENLEKALRELKKQQEEKQRQQKQNQQQPKMTQKEADQKLKLLSQREKELQKRLQNQSKQKGNGQSQDW